MPMQTPKPTPSSAVKPSVSSAQTQPPRATAPRGTPARPVSHAQILFTDFASI